jgi:uncharacterized protein (UPF0548 family)
MADRIEHLLEKSAGGVLKRALAQPILRRTRAARKRRAARRFRLLGGGTGAVLATFALAAWWWSRQRLQKSEQRVDLADRRVLPPPTLPEDIPNKGDLQLIADGYGALYYRRYQIDITRPTETPAAIMRAVMDDINHFTPGELASFRKTKGDPDRFAVGDEWYIRITGPWDARVRTVRVSDTAFTFVTLKGHIEAGEIHFEAMEHPEEPGCIRFRIQSWARSRDWLVNVFYTHLGIAQLAQTGMWVTFAHRALEASGGEPASGDAATAVNVLTASAPYDEDVPQWQRYRPMFDRYQNVACNFDLERREEYTEANGWHIDDYATELPGENPGPPHPHGAWKAACDVLLNYEFPDPDLITGIFVPDVPLADRIMVLRARFLVFQFMFGVRIGDVIDEEREDPAKGRARVWGFSYRTLEGHFEMGEITFTIWKFLETGAVEFRIHAYSKTGLIRNPFYRVGFALFGRSLQIRFARTAMERMRQFVIKRTTGVDYTQSEPLETVEVQSAAEDAGAAEKLDAIAEAGGTPAAQ